MPNERSARDRPYFSVGFCVGLGKSPTGGVFVGLWKRGGKCFVMLGGRVVERLWGRAARCLAEAKVAGADRGETV